MRQMVYAALPLGKGVIADPFMGSGSTIAAAEAMGLQAIGAERYLDYFKMAADSIPELALVGKGQAQRVKTTSKTAKQPPDRKGLDGVGAINPI